MDIELGRRASHELGMTNEAMGKMKQACFDKLLKLDPADAANINRVIATAQAIDWVKEILNAYVIQGDSQDEMIKRLNL